MVVLVLAMVAGVQAAPLRLDLDACTNVDPGIVVRVVTLELGEAPKETEHNGSITQASVVCRGHAIVVNIDDPVTGKKSSRTLDLNGQEQAIRSRLLGLAISEAVLSSWIELEIAPTPAVPSPSATASTAVRREVERITSQRLKAVLGPPVPHLQLAAGPTRRWFGSGATATGVSLVGNGWLGRHPSLGMGLAMDMTNAEQNVAGIGSGSAFGFSLAPRLAVRTSFNRASVIAEAGWRVGLVRLVGEPYDTLRAGRSSYAAWTGPMFGGALDMRVWSKLFLRASLEGGRVVNSARGTIGEDRVFALDGSWVQAAFSLGVNP
jgi:hypothetical protein